MASDEPRVSQPTVAVSSILTNAYARKFAARFVGPYLSRYRMEYRPLEGIDMWSMRSGEATYGYSLQFDRRGGTNGNPVRFDIRFYVAHGRDVWDWADVERFGGEQSRVTRVLAHLFPDRVWVRVDSTDALEDALERFVPASLRAFDNFVRKHGGDVSRCADH